MNRAIVDYYRCPEDVVEFKLAERLTADPGFFRFGAETICYGNSSAGVRSKQVIGTLYDALNDAKADRGTVHLPFDPDEIVENLRYERYRTVGDGRPTRLGHSSAAVRSLYYGLRPFLPVQIRKHLQRAYLSDWREIPFPRWPIDRTVEDLLERLLVLSMRARGLQRVPFVWFWPDGMPSCALMGHDVEHLDGQEFCAQLMEMDDAVGIKSSFQIVPEARYPVTDAFLETIRARGFEINVHDLNHDGRLFADHGEFLRRAERINAYGRKYGALGFRSGALYRNQAWYGALEFSYDMSVPSVAHLDPQRGGCCSLMPFFIGKILELPVTAIQDYSLFHILNDYSVDLWKQQTDSIAEKHGLISFIIHPDYIRERRARSTYQLLLEHLARMRDERRTWIALPREIDRWWRERSKLEVVPYGSSWRINGAGKERARLAFAVLTGDRLTYSLEEPK